MVMGARVDWADLLDWVVTIIGICILIAIVAYILIGVVVILRAEALCLEQGFPNSSTVWNLKSYCVSFYDAKPVVVPLR
jgi:hypothetical protein